MNKIGVLALILLLAFFSLEAQARLYRWVDDKGNVQFSDKPPPSDAKGLAELDQRGMVRKEQEKPVSASEISQKEAEKQAQVAQRRRDNALLQSFSRPDEIDFLRDRQIMAVNARVQTNKLRRQAMEEKLKRLTAQVDGLTKAKKTVPPAVAADLEGARKELAALDADAEKMATEIVGIKERAEADKKRLQELRGLASSPSSAPLKK